MSGSNKLGWLQLFILGLWVVVMVFISPSWKGWLIGYLVLCLLQWINKKVWVRLGLPTDETPVK